MWQRIITLSIAVALACGAWAQQNDKDAQKSLEEQKLREAVDAREKAERNAQEAIRRDIADKVGAVQADRQRVRAAAAQAEAELAIEAQQRLLGAQDARRAWTRMAAVRQTKKEKVTYCGVSTTEPPAVLIEQLKLTRGLGLVVDFVEPGSPAEAAGLKQYDVITKFNDQLLSNAEQLGVLVRLKKPSDDAKLTVIRQGQPISINVELGQKEMEVEIENAAVPQEIQPPAFALRADGRITATPRITRFGGGGGGIAFTNNQVGWSDDQNNLTLDMQNGKATKMVAKDKTGKEVFNGPVETDDQRKALPADLAEKLKKAEEGGPVRFTYRTGARAAAAPRARVVTSTVNDTLLLARIENGRATHAFAFSTTDGKTLFDGATASEEDRKALPEPIARQLDQLEKNPAAATEFGVVGRN